MSKQPTSLIDEKVKIYSALQGEIQKLFAQKQQVLSQFNENILVKGELEILEPGAKVLKLVGPVMMSIELNEALQNVTKRLEFIEAEVKKVDSGIEAKQKEQNDLGDEIAKLQQQMQADAVSAAKQVAGLA